MFDKFYNLFSEELEAPKKNENEGEGNEPSVKVEKKDSYEGYTLAKINIISSGVLALNFIIFCIQFSMPFLLSSSINDLNDQHSDQDKARPIAMLFAYALLYFVAGALEQASLILQRKQAQEKSINISTETVDHLYQLSTHDINKQKSDFLINLTSQVYRSYSSYISSTSFLIINLAKLAALPIVLAIKYSLWFLPICWALTVVNYFVSSSQGKAIAKKQSNEKSDLPDLYKQLNVIYKKPMDILSFGTLDLERTKLENVLKTTNDAIYESNAAQSLAIVSQVGISALVLWFSLWSVAFTALSPNSDIDSDDFSFAITFILQFIVPLSQLTFKFIELEGARTSLMPIIKILKTKTKDASFFAGNRQNVDPKGDAVDEEMANKQSNGNKRHTFKQIQAIEFKDVTFSHPGSKISLQGISFQLLPGKTYAVVGDSGLGKTSLVELLLGFYDVISGEIAINGKSVDSTDLSRIRQDLSAYMRQEITIFDETLKDNCMYGSKKLKDSDITQYVDCADFDENLLRLLGSDSSVGPYALSGGQKKRVGLVRMLAREPVLYVLDEPTSSWSRPLTQAVMNNFFTYFRAEAIKRKNVYSMCISHERFIAENADEVIFLEKSTAATNRDELATVNVTTGRHDDLLRRCRAYDRFWNSSPAEEHTPDIRQRSRPGMSGNR